MPLTTYVSIIDSCRRRYGGFSREAAADALGSAQRGEGQFAPYSTGVEGKQHQQVDQPVLLDLVADLLSSGAVL